MENIITNNYRMQAYNLILYEYFCIEFIDFMLKGKRLLDYTNLFSFNDYEKNEKHNTKIFSITKTMKKLFCVICGKHRKFEEPEISYIVEKH